MPIVDDRSDITPDSQGTLTRHLFSTPASTDHLTAAAVYR